MKLTVADRVTFKELTGAGSFEAPVFFVRIAKITSCCSSPAHVVV